MTSYGKNTHPVFRYRSVAKSDRWFIDIKELTKVGKDIVEKVQITADLRSLIKTYLVLKGCTNIHINLTKFDDILRVGYEVPIFGDERNVAGGLMDILTCKHCFWSKDLGEFVPELKNNKEERGDKV